MAEFKARLDDKKWRLRLKKMTGKLNAPAKLIRAAYGIAGFKDIIDHFKKEKGPKGKWVSRKQSTNIIYDKIRKGKFVKEGKKVKYKVPENGQRRQFDSRNKILSLSGATRQSILPRNSKILSKNSVLVFANTKWSGRHNRGDRPSGTPQRMFMWLSTKAKRLMLKIMIRTVIGKK